MNLEPGIFERDDESVCPECDEDFGTYEKLEFHVFYEWERNGTHGELIPGEKK